MLSDPVGQDVEVFQGEDGATAPNDSGELFPRSEAVLAHG